MTKAKDKWDSLDKSTQKWATRLGSFAAIIGIIAAAATWAITQFGQVVSGIVDDRFTTLEEEMLSIKRSTVRTELLLLIQDDPENVMAIERLALAYFNPPLNGDSYMSSIVSSWATTHGIDPSILFNRES